jgi:hypothetical protein
MNYRVLGELFQRIGGPFERYHPPPKHFVAHGATYPGMEMSQSSVT